MKFTSIDRSAKARYRLEFQFSSPFHVHFPGELSHVTYSVITSFDLLFDSFSLKHGFFHRKDVILEMREINQRTE